jgi:hypothetical protein
MKKRELNAAAIEKISANAAARAKIVKEKAEAYRELLQQKKKLKDEAYEKSHKLAIERQENLKKHRLEMSRKRQQDVGKNQMERHLHSIHPALGVLYGITKNKPQKENQKDEDGSLLNSAAIGGIAGLAGGNAGSFGRKALKFAGKGLGLPIIGAVASGIIEAAESGDLMKGAATASGTLGGTAIGAMIGTALLPGIGTYIGGLVGGWLGGLSAKQFYNMLNNSPETPVKGTGRFASLNPGTSNVAKVSPNGSSSTATPGSGLSVNYDDHTKVGGTKSWRNNNAGNIRYGEYAQKMGAIGKDKDGFAIFPDEATGDEARKKLIFASNSYKNLSLNDAIARYAPPNENNTSLYQKTISKAAGLSGNERMSSLSPETQNIILAAMKKHEGYKPGKIVENKIALQKGPSLVSNLKSASDASRASAMAKSSQAAKVTVNNVNGGGGSPVVNNITHVNNAPSMDSTIRQLANQSMYMGKPL